MELECYKKLNEEEKSVEGKTEYAEFKKVKKLLKELEMNEDEKFIYKSEYRDLG